MFLIFRNKKDSVFFVFSGILQIKRKKIEIKKGGLFYSSESPIVTVYSKFSVFFGRIERVHFPAVPGTV